MVSRSEVINNGKKLIEFMYGATRNWNSLDEFRAMLARKKGNQLKLKSLPPTSDAAQFHSLRAYFQVQTWLGVTMDPSEYGWEQTPEGLLPVTMTKSPAPDELMAKIMCGCTKGCASSSGCSCRKGGLKCSDLCHCSGESCLNTLQPNIKL